MENRTVKDFWAHRVILGYKFSEKLGNGEFGSVFDVHKENDPHDTAALKIISGQKVLKEHKVYDRLMIERDILNRISHENIVRINDFCYYPETDDYMLFKEECHNGELYESFKNQNRLWEEHEAIFTIGCVINGYRLLDMYEIMHRNINLKNIEMHGDFVKLNDFGGLKYKGRKGKSSYGSPLYIAPEMHANFMKSKTRQNNANFTIDYYDSKVDVFSLGCIFYELLNQIPLMNLLQKKDKWYYEIKIKYDTCIGDNLKVPSRTIKKNHFISDNTVNLLKKMTQKDPANRMSQEELFEEPIFKNFHLVDEFKHAMEQRNFTQIKGVEYSFNDVKEVKEMLDNYPFQVPRDEIKMNTEGDNDEATKYFNSYLVKLKEKDFKVVVNSTQQTSKNAEESQDRHNFSRFFIVALEGGNYQEESDLMVVGIRKQHKNPADLIFKNVTDQELSYFRFNDERKREFLFSLKPGTAKTAQSEPNQIYEIYNTKYTNMENELKPSNIVSSKTGIAKFSCDTALEPHFIFCTPLVDRKRKYASHVITTSSIHQEKLYRIEIDKDYKLQLQNSQEVIQVTEEIQKKVEDAQKGQLYEMEPPHYFIVKIKREDIYVPKEKLAGINIWIEKGKRKEVHAITNDLQEAMKFMNVKYGETFYLTLKDEKGNEYKEELKLEAVPLTPLSIWVKLDLSKLDKELCGFLNVKFKKFLYSVPTVQNTIQVVGQNVESKSKKYIELIHPNKLDKAKYEVFYHNSSEELRHFENTELDNKVIINDSNIQDGNKNTDDKGKVSDGPKKSTVISDAAPEETKSRRSNKPPQRPSSSKGSKRSVSKK